MSRRHVSISRQDRRSLNAALKKGNLQLADEIAPRFTKRQRGLGGTIRGISPMSRQYLSTHPQLSAYWRLPR